MPVRESRGRRVMADVVTYGAYPYRVCIGADATEEDIVEMFDTLEQVGLRLTQNWERGSDGILVIECEEGSAYDSRQEGVAEASQLLGSVFVQRVRGALQAFPAVSSG